MLSPMIGTASRIMLSPFTPSDGSRMKADEKKIELILADAKGQPVVEAFDSEVDDEDLDEDESEEA